MENLQPPKTIEEVGIHLVYLSKAMSEMSTKLDSYGSNFVPNNIFLVYQESMNDRVKKLEGAADATERFQQKWSGRVWGINTTIVAIFSLLTLLAIHYWPTAISTPTYQESYQQSSITK